MRDIFHRTHGPITDFVDLFDALKAHINTQALQHRIDGQLTDNRLVGLQWYLTRTDIPYIGESIEHAEMRQQGKHYNKNKDLGYSGKVWLRLEKQIVGSPSHLFHGSMYHIGTGGYSTWEGPWQDYGKECNALEQGVPHNLRRHLEVYAFSSHFYVSDFPDIDQYAVMQKLSDDELPKVTEKFWFEDGLEDRDERYIEYLKNFKEKQHVV